MDGKSNGGGGGGGGGGGEAGTHGGGASEGTAHARRDRRSSAPTPDPTRRGKQYLREHPTAGRHPGGTAAAEA
eukprot:5774456-Alexandrium_andersonii.AAC.1